MLNSASDKNRLLQDDIAVKAQALLASIKAQDVDQATILINELALINNDNIARAEQQQTLESFNKIARELNELIKFTDVQNVDSIISTKERLNQVIEMSAESANKTLDGIDLMMPLLGDLRDKSKNLLDLWNKFLIRQMSFAEFNAYLLELKKYVFDVADASDLIYKNLKEILIAQNFQDLSGQAIKKVITFIGQIETRLIALTSVVSTLEMSVAYDLPAKTEVAEDKQNTANSANKPTEAEIDRSSRVTGQNDVDDLLSSLGF